MCMLQQTKVHDAKAPQMSLPQHIKKIGSKNCTFAWEATAGTRQKHEKHEMRYIAAILTSCLAYHISCLGAKSLICTVRLVADCLLPQLMHTTLSSRPRSREHLAKRLRHQVLPGLQIPTFSQVCQCVNLKKHPDVMYLPFDRQQTTR